jgi:hypothetical protein
MRRVAKIVLMILGLSLKAILLAFALVGIALGISMIIDHGRVSTTVMLAVVAITVTCIQSVVKWDCFSREASRERSREDELIFKPIGGKQ